MSQPKPTVRNLRKAALIIEPERHLRRLVASMLRAAGIQEIYESESHEDTLEKARHFEIDLVLMNARQGDVGYRKVVADMRQEPRVGKCIPLILYGSELTPGQISNAQRDGIDLALMTPFSVTTLVERLNHVLHQKRYCQFCKHNDMAAECFGKRAKGARVARSA